MSKAYVSKALREKVAAQARYRCGYCLTQEDVVGTPMDIEHIVLEVLGGLTQEENLWLACGLCNAFKGDRVSALDPESASLVPLFNTRTQIWNEHFAWSDSRDEVIGKTAIGRATIHALRLNRAILVGARKRWIRANMHPPDE